MATLAARSAERLLHPLGPGQHLGRRGARRRHPGPSPGDRDRRRGSMLPGERPALRGHHPSRRCRRAVLREAVVHPDHDARQDPACRGPRFRVDGATLRRDASLGWPHLRCRLSSLPASPPVPRADPPLVGHPVLAPLVGACLTPRSAGRSTRPWCPYPGRLPGCPRFSQNGRDSGAIYGAPEPTATGSAGLADLICVVLTSSDGLLRGVLAT